MKYFNRYQINDLCHEVKRWDGTNLDIILLWLSSAFGPHLIGTINTDLSLQLTDNRRVNFNIPFMSFILLRKSDDSFDFLPEDDFYNDYLPANKILAGIHEKVGFI